MSFYPCEGCWVGEHSKHQAEIQGGTCTCKGECETSPSPSDKLLAAIFEENKSIVERYRDDE